jgi:hypothetical protein
MAFDRRFPGVRCNGNMMPRPGCQIFGVGYSKSSQGRWGAGTRDVSVDGKNCHWWILRRSARRTMNVYSTSAHCPHLHHHVPCHSGNRAARGDGGGVARPEKLPSSTTRQNVAQGALTAVNRVSIYMEVLSHARKVCRISEANLCNKRERSLICEAAYDCSLCDAEKT